jgi:hypothetical protein
MINRTDHFVASLNGDLFEVENFKRMFSLVYSLIIDEVSKTIAEEFFIDSNAAACWKESRLLFL